jgi:hypothetical protein
MLSFILVGVALLVNFYSPTLERHNVLSRTSLTELGFPYFYYQGEYLNENEVKYRIKIVYFNTIFGICGFSSLGGSITQVGLPFIYKLPLSSIELLLTEKSQPQFRDFLKIAPNMIPENIVFTKEQIQQMDQLALEVRNKTISENEAILALRGGDGWIDGATIFVFMLFVNWLNGVEGFGILLPQMNNFPNIRWTPEPDFLPGFTPTSSKQLSTSTSTQLQKPSEMSQAQYNGLSKSEKRKLTHANDMFICNDGHPQLRVGFNQAEFKTPDHGKIHGLPLQENGKASKADAAQLQQSLVDIGNDPNAEWYHNGSYQDQDSVNILDPVSKILSVYKKLPDENYFLTTVQLTQVELKHFKLTNGKFLSEKILSSQKSLVIYKPVQSLNPDTGSKVNEGTNNINEKKL